MKIAELIEDYDKLAVKREYRKTKTASEKQGFVANPNVPPPQPGQPVQQALPPGQMDPAMQQQAQTQQAPQQAAAPAPQGADPLMEQAMGMIQQLPPETQQQVMPMVQQLQQLPPEQRDPQLQQLIQQLQGGGQQQAQQPQPQAQQPQPQPQAQPQPGMVAQAGYEEDMMTAMQQQQAMQDPAMQQQQQDPTQQAAQDAGDAEASAINAKNELDNVKVTLSVRELLDLVGKGTATASLLKVKQLADTHQQKMDQTKQKADQQAQQAQQQQQQTEQQGMMGSGGIYPTPMGG
jgi:hypothetical protein